MKGSIANMMPIPNRRIYRAASLVFQFREPLFPQIMDGVVHNLNIMILDGLLYRLNLG